MTAARYALGLAALTVTVGSALWSAVQVRRRALPTWSGAVARLAEAVVALAEVIAVEEALGAVGLFRRGTVLVTIVVAAATLGLLCRRRLERRVPPPRLREEHGERRTSAPLGTAAAAAAAAAALPLVTSQPGQATPATAALFFLLAAFAFLLTGAWETSAVVLAAVATGLAVSSKLSLLAPAAALSLGVVLLNRRRRPALALAWVLPLAVSGGYWYARNLA